jgi:tRNA(fMet)-specific endonuclease VapC
VRRYLLDTTVLAAYLYNRPSVVTLLSPWMQNRELATSILVYGEVVEHLKSRPDFQRHQQQLRELLAEVQPFFLTYRILERYADLRRALRPPHGPGLIGDIDTLVAATGIERDLTLVTADSDFQRVPNLNVHLIPRQSLTSR